MIDLKKVRDDVAAYKLICKHKLRLDVDVDHILSLDDQRKETQQKVDDLKFQQRQLAEKKDYEWAKRLKGEIQQLDDFCNKIEEELTPLLLNMPNFYHPDTPIGKTPEENVVMLKWWTPPTFDFPILDHEDLWKKWDIIDKETASKVSWTRFCYLKWDLVLLQMALIQFTFKTLWDEKIIKKIIKEKKLQIKATPFRPVLTPQIISMETMNKMGRLYPMDERYCLNEDKQVMNGSAEHAMWPMFMDHMFQEDELPVRYIWYATSFRREAGSYGKDVKWIIRVHQFDKLEMETFCLWETSGDEQELIIGLQEYMMQQLALPYQLILKCTADMWDNDYRAVDVETWMSGQWIYRETHTSDLMTDFQSRRLNTRVKRTNGDKEFVHMNDATAFAMWRIMVAIIENNQQVDGKIKIPEVLVPYMGKEFIWR